MNDRGEQVFGIARVDGGAGPTETTLYLAAGLDVRELAASEYLFITDIDLFCETGGDVWYDQDVDDDDDHDAQDIVLQAALPATGRITRSYTTPHQCQKGEKPKLYGPDTNQNVCIIHGFITKA